MNPSGHFGNCTKEEGGEEIGGGKQQNSWPGNIKRVEGEISVPSKRRKINGSSRGEGSRRKKSEQKKNLGIRGPQKGVGVTSQGVIVIEGGANLGGTAWVGTLVGGVKKTKTQTANNGLKVNREQFTLWKPTALWERVEMSKGEWRTKLFDRESQKTRTNPQQRSKRRGKKKGK